MSIFTRQSHTIVEIRSLKEKNAELSRQLAKARGYNEEQKALIEKLKRNNNNERAVGGGRQPWVWAVALLSLGLVLTLLYGPFDAHTVFTHIGVALMVAGGITLLIELPDYAEYAKETFKKIVIEREYLKKMSSDELETIKQEIDTVLTGSSDIGRPGGFYNFTGSKFREFIQSPYRTNYSDVVTILPAEKAPSEFVVPDGFWYLERHVSYNLFKGHSRLTPIDVVWAVILRPQMHSPRLERHTIVSPPGQLITKLQKALKQPNCSRDRTPVDYLASRLRPDMQESIKSYMNGDAEHLLSELIVAVNELLDSQVLFFDEEAFRTVSLPGDLAQIVKRERPTCMMADVNRYLLEVAFTEDLKQGGNLGLGLLFDFSLQVGATSFRLDRGDFQLKPTGPGGDELDSIPLTVDLLDVPEPRVGIKLTYPVPESESLRPEDSVLVKYEARVAVKQDGEGSFVKMVAPTKDLSIHYRFPEDTVTSADVFGFLKGATIIKEVSKEHVFVKYDGWLLPGHGIAVFWSHRMERPAERGLGNKPAAGS